MHLLTNRCKVKVPCREDASFCVVILIKRKMSVSFMSCTSPHLRDEGPRFDANEGRSEDLGERVHRAIGPYRHGVQIWEAFHSSEVGFRAKPFDARRGTDKPEGYDTMFWREAMTVDA